VHGSATNFLLSRGSRTGGESRGVSGAEDEVLVLVVLGGVGSGSSVQDASKTVDSTAIAVTEPSREIMNPPGIRSEHTVRHTLPRAERSLTQSGNSVVT